MRQARQKQLNLNAPWLPLEHASELAAIDRVLDQVPTVAELVWRDLNADRAVRNAGAEGMSAEQVLRVLVVKQMNGFSYRELAFHLADSRSYRTFCRLSLGQRPSKTMLATSIKAIRSATLEKINRLMVGVADKKKIEDGVRVRVDTTVVESNIHAPLDSNLLSDCVRVLTRVMGNTREILGPEVSFPNRTRRARRRALGILNARFKEKRKPLYRDLVLVVKETIESANRVIAVVDGRLEAPTLSVSDRVRTVAARKELAHFIGLSLRVIDQTERRVFNEQSVPAKEKVVSIFEEHTDIIVNGAHPRSSASHACALP